MEMQDRNTIWDPLRKKEVALTPEERVRQWCVTVLAENMKIPMHMMMTEAGFTLGEKQFRADILVYDRKARPLMIVECKRPEVDLTRTVLDQAIRYNMALNVRYIMVTNGLKTIVCRNEKGTCVFMDTVPQYEEMICQQQ
ncbi:MAG: type I restriction enzyme HsdR N-terminal domain-containing protein [Bacteroidales bacterium]|nr:type I restriction enzyme HsdR N-terminal domain-containing protein [Bacteroidales bacterium]